MTAKVGRRNVKAPIWYLVYGCMLLQVRELIHDYYNSRYTTCLKHLQALRPSLQVSEGEKPDFCPSHNIGVGVAKDELESVACQWLAHVTPMI
eukprot:scaffold390484_cov50-Prasinocladus_malaysianus.AAC.1